MLSNGMHRNYIWMQTFPLHQRLCSVSFGDCNHTYLFAHILLCYLSVVEEGATATWRGSEGWIGNAAREYKPCSPDLHMQSIAREQLCELSRRWSYFFCCSTQLIIHHRPAKFIINYPVCVLHTWMFFYCCSWFFSSSFHLWLFSLWLINLFISNAKEKKKSKFCRLSWYHGIFNCGFFFVINMMIVQDNLRAPRLIPWVLKFTTM